MLLVRKRILAERADENGFIDDLHGKAVGFLGYLDRLGAVETRRV